VAERASGLPRQLLAFSRKQAARSATLNLNEVVSGVAKMLQSVIGEQVRLRLECSSNLPSVCADAGMIEQVLMNLALNARDAMPRGGQLVIGTTHVVFDESRLSAHPLARPGEFATIQVSDTGCGMKPEVFARVFEPFFTTKQPGEGTGLGLATVFNIVQRHQGWVEFHSAVEKGTVFKVFLPCAPVGKETPDPLPAPLKPRRGTETILLVEDEPQVRRLALQTLEHQGYRVFAAASGATALFTWHQQGGKIDLLITDMVMPDGMNGAELIEKLRLLNPGLRAVLMSGYCMDSSDQGNDLKDDVTFLQKPYAPGKLCEVARTALDA
jgi:CheY-like chemotaxis protein